MARITTIYDEETDTEVQLPLKWVICGCCRGEGKSSLYIGAITASDRMPGGEWEDPDDFEDYMNGEYDRHCDECDGTGKVQVVDEELLTEDQRRAWKADCDEEEQYQAAVRAERRMGA